MGSAQPFDASSAMSDSSTAPSTVHASTAPSLGSGCTTPLTSASATPAPKDPIFSAVGRRLNRIEVHIPAARVRPPRRTLGQPSSISSNKRKRNVEEDSDEDYSDTSPDAVLARKLQAEENAAALRSLDPSAPRHPAAKPAATATSLDTMTSVGASAKSRQTSRRTFRVSRGGLAPRKPPPKLQAVEASHEEDDSDFSDDDNEDDEDWADDGEPSANPDHRAEIAETHAQFNQVLENVLDPGASLNPDSGDESFHSAVEPPAAEERSDESDSWMDGIRQAMRRRRAYRLPRNKRRAERDRGRLEHHHPELKTMWKELEDMPVLKAGKAEQPKTISRHLKPFQLEGLAWMMAMEKTAWKGGLLGDEMGLGKTIQAVSLIMSDFPAGKPSLVLVPPVALMQWVSEIESYTDGRLKTLVMHGTNAKAKNLTVKDIKKYDVIIMSYNSLESMYRKQEKGFNRKDGPVKEKSVIHQTEFHRVILDEAHCIKTRTTMTAKACFALKVTYRWCLSGTPLQNRIGEFFSLIRFLNIRPFACYLCKHCPCSTLEWTMDEMAKCTECNHGGMQHVSVFNQELLNPIQKFGNRGRGAEAFRKLRILTDRIMLRRLKKDHMDSMELPVKEINVERQFFGEEENDFASSIMTNSQRKFDTYVASGVMLNNYANIFGLIMQMRQVADHPDLILKKNAEGGQNILVCSICDEPAEDAIRSRCKHDFCRACVKSYINSTTSPDCPQCHIPLSIDLEQPEIEQDEALVKKSSIINRIKMENWTSSSKIELLVHELHKLRSDNASHKSIIFSQFTTMLQLIEWRLRRAGITTVMLDGSMTPAQRAASIDHFMNNADVECFLVSLKAGGVALNLTEASRVFIVDPWWNPAAYVYFSPELNVPQELTVDFQTVSGSPQTGAIVSARHVRASSLACASRTRSRAAWSCCRRRRPT
jgi:DNA repair protein RAD16